MSGTFSRKIERYLIWVYLTTINGRFLTHRSCRVAPGTLVQLLLVLVPHLAHELGRHQPQLLALLHQPPHHARRHGRELDLHGSAEVTGPPARGHESTAPTAEVRRSRSANQNRTS